MRSALGGSIGDSSTEADATLVVSALDSVLLVSLAVSAGVNVLALQRMLGHTSAKVTLDTYADLWHWSVNDLDGFAP